jgi:tricorn protease
MKRMRLLFPAAAVLWAATLCPTSVAHAQSTRLLRHPAISHDAIAFEYGGDLWSVGRSGGTARRLTSTPEMETDPHFSPDGSMIAFSHTMGANTDVFVMPASGGEPRRLTFYPGINRVRGWSPDGRRVLFATDRSSVPQASFLRLYTVAREGGPAEALPMPRAFRGTYAPDGRRIAYEEISTVFIPGWYEISGWRHYRGGRTHPISVMTLGDHSVEKLPWNNSNDTDPVWVGNTIYFLSDRNFTTNVFSYRTDTKALKQMTTHDDFDVENVSATDDALVYEQAGDLHLVDLATGADHKLNIDVVGDFAWARPQFKKVAPMIQEAALSPTGARAVFGARGDIFTVPAEKGDWRNLTRSPGAHDRSPAWAPDGAQVAWLSDQSGEYQLMIGDQLGTTKARAIALPTLGFFSQLAWSPDGRQISLEDNHLNLWVIEVASGRATKLDSDTYSTPGRSFDATWSPDSRWLAYSKSLPSHFRAIFVRSLADAKSVQITDGFADANAPAFDAGGRYLYFLASTDFGLHSSWLDMSQIDRTVHRSAYLAVLRAEDPSPFLPESSEEPTSAARTALIAPPRVTPTAVAKPDSGVKVESSGRGAVRIDEAGIRQRIIPLNIPAGDLSELTAGTAETFLFAERGAPAAGNTLRLQRFQIKDRTVTTVLEGIRSFSLSADKKKLLYSAGGGANARWGIVSTEKPAKVGDGLLNVAALEMRVDPLAEWAEIFTEAWRTQREFFYDPNMHGANWNAMRAKYAPLVPFVRHRADLGYLIEQMGGELVVGHSYLTGAGDESMGPVASTGLLGADYAVENGHYRISRIYGGESWNPELRAPLSGPGVHVATGDYLLEVDGHPVSTSRSVYEPFEETAGRQTVLRINSSPSTEGSRLVTVVPVASEEALRTRVWIEDNRRKVDSMSNGRLAYVWLPNTGAAGYTSFVRYFYAQQNKEGAIIDERYNHGGMVADYIVGELSRKLTGGYATRDGLSSTSPIAGLYGPKVMLINESAGSGGDALPYNFRANQLGPLIGTRTWGGLVGTTGVPSTIDGGGITAPGLAFFNLKNEWAIENEGVAPDIEVVNDEAAVIAGRDPQLERGVREALRLLGQTPASRVTRPPPIDRASKRPTQ